MPLLTRIYNDPILFCLYNFKILIVMVQSFKFFFFLETIDGCYNSGKWCHSLIHFKTAEILFFWHFIIREDWIFFIVVALILWTCLRERKKIGMVGEKLKDCKAVFYLIKIMYSKVYIYIEYNNEFLSENGLHWMFIVSIYNNTAKEVLCNASSYMLYIFL